MTDRSAVTQGLLAYYTFDGQNIDPAQVGAEVRDVSSAALHTGQVSAVAGFWDGFGGC